MLWDNLASRLRVLADSLLPSIKQVHAIRSQLASAAQRVYDAWEVDPSGEVDDEYAGGGICHDIADGLLSVLNHHNIEAHSVSSSHEVHVYVVGAFKEGVFKIDVPYSIYETGGGYSWKKIEDVTFDANDIDIDKIDSDPEELHQYIDEY